MRAANLVAISLIARRTGGLAVGVSHLVSESAGERVEIAEMGAQVANTPQTALL